jgi:hypothetical protein
MQQPMTSSELVTAILSGTGGADTSGSGLVGAAQSSQELSLPLGKNRLLQVKWHTVLHVFVQLNCNTLKHVLAQHSIVICCYCCAYSLCVLPAASHLCPT